MSQITLCGLLTYGIFTFSLRFQKEVLNVTDMKMVHKGFNVGDFHFSRKETYVFRINLYGSLIYGRFLPFSFSHFQEAELGAPDIYVVDV